MSDLVCSCPQPGGDPEAWNSFLDAYSGLVWEAIEQHLRLRQQQLAFSTRIYKAHLLALRNKSFAEPSCSESFAEPFSN